MKSIYDYPLKKLETYFDTHGEKKFKATQVFDWLYKKRVRRFDDMRNIKKEVIETLKRDFSMEPLTIIEKLEDIDVCKYLFSLEDGNKIEAVLMRHDYGNSLCVSTQVGCNMGCAFCESGRLKKVRNLEPSEMVLQILAIEEDLQIRITHVVLMGIGEPFDNYENVVKAIKIINDQKGINIGARHISVSTSGIVPRIYDLAKENIQCTLSISLHATTDEKRSSMMPINKKYNIEELIKACKDYIKITGRRVSFEYALAKDNNDNIEDARKLVELLKGMLCHVNLIPINKIENGNFLKSSNENIIKFRNFLNEHGIVATIRRELGTDIDAACGQLRRKNLK